jgi:hypothetical protein
VLKSILLLLFDILLQYEKGFAKHQNLHNPNLQVVAEQTVSQGVKLG